MRIRHGLRLLSTHLARPAPHVHTGSFQLARICCSEGDVRHCIRLRVLVEALEVVGVVQPRPLVLLQEGQRQARHVRHPLRVHANCHVLLLLVCMLLLLLQVLLQQQGLLLQGCVLGDCSCLRHRGRPASLLGLLNGGMRALRLCR